MMLCDRIQGSRTWGEDWEAPFTIPRDLLEETLLSMPSAGLEVLISRGEIGHFHQGTQ